MNYRMATHNDIDLLVSLRMEFINITETDESYNAIKDNCYLYFENAFENNTCDAVLVEEAGKYVGTGIAFYYDSVPSVLNITGKNAYITSLYVEPKYRRKKIGTTILEMLLDKIRERDYKIIMLNASDMGKSLYEKFGFIEIENGMILNTQIIPE